MPLFLLVFLAFLSVQTPLPASEFLGVIEQPLIRAYIPVGFDNNDSTQIMVAGKFKSTCFQTGTFYTSVDRKKKIIEVQLSAYEYQGNCLQVEAPFYQVIPLGLIGTPGSFTVIDRVSKQTLGVLEIAKAPEQGVGTDEFSYAPLFDAYLVERGSGKKILVLTGVFGDSCIKFKEIDVKYYDDVVVVTPTIHKPGVEKCEKAHVAFQKQLELRSNLPDTFLLHVRSMGGQAINKMVALKAKGTP